jgi:hypothetical protein
MARYFFHLHRGEVTALDEDGVDCPTIRVVRETAIQKIRDVLCDDIPHGRLRLDSSILVEDEQRQAAMTIPFKDASYDIKT